MQSLLSNRALLTGAVLVPCGLLAAWAYARSRPVQLGDMTMPDLSGWEKRTITATTSPQVNYRKMEQGHRLYIGLTNKFGGGPTPKTIQDLSNEAIKAGAGRTRTLKSTGMIMKFGLPHPVRLGNLPAIESRGTFTTKRNVTFNKVTYLLKGSKYYILVTNITVPSPNATSVPPQIQSEMDGALATITKSLTSSS